MNIVFFDGVCHLCSGYINFLIRFDSQNNLYYSALQGLKAQELLTESQRLNLDSIIYYKQGQILTQSEAILESLCDANRWFLPLKVFYVIPRSLRNMIYKFIAKNRYAFWGQRSACRIPTAEERKYLLD